MEKSVTIQAVVTGKVQGVGFRYTTMHYAEELAITGLAKNLPNGSVELVLQGSEEAIDTLLDRLQETFKIRTLDRSYLVAEKPIRGFSVL